jgi:predicted MFS family arabinose efflux permease
MPAIRLSHRAACRHRSYWEEVTYVLRLSAYRRLLVAYTLNELAWSGGSLALTVLVYRHTGSALGAAAYFLCALFVPALFAPWLVARLDDRPIRPTLSALYGIEVVVYGVLAWSAGHFSLVPVLVLTLLDGLLALTARAIARTATVAVLSPAGLLPEGNALSNAAFSLCFMAGPAIAGVVVATAGISVMLITVAVVFGLIALTVLGTRGLPAPVSSPRAGRLRAALEHLREQPLARTLILLQGAAVLFFSISVPVEIILARKALHTGASGYGVMIAAWGAGAVAGSAIYAKGRRLSARTLIVGGAACLGCGFIVMAVSPSLGVAITGAAVAGTGNGIEAVAARTALQEHVEERWMGMTMGLNESILQATTGGGIIVGGAIAALAGPRVALGVAGGGSLAITVVAWIALAGLGAEKQPAPAETATAQPAPAART